MSTARVVWCAALATFIGLGGDTHVATQSAPLRIVSAAPTGQLEHFTDATQIRVVFSEPMVPIGVADPPAWVRLTPAVRGTFYWSGTRTLIFAPDPHSPFPRATSFTLHIDAAATSVAGRSLGVPYELTFATPAVKLEDVDSYRENDRFDGAVVLGLEFDQPVKAADVLAHVRVAHAPHAWTAPVLSREARKQLRTSDPAGLAAFDRRVADTQLVSASRDPVAIELATTWDEDRLTRRDDGKLVVIRTVGAPPPGAWLSITADRVPSPEGPLTGGEQSEIVRLAPAFFVTGTACETRCDPTIPSVLRFSTNVPASAVARSLEVADITDTPARALIRRDTPDLTSRPTEVRLDELGFDIGHVSRRYRVDVSAGLVSDDGQRLGYPWRAFIETALAPPLIAFDGMVLEAGTGASIPLNVRNLTGIRQFVTRLAPPDIMPSLRASLTQAQPHPSLSAGSRQRLRVPPGGIQLYDVPVASSLSPQGTGIVRIGAAAAGVVKNAPAVTLASHWNLSAMRDRARDTVIQVTNLGVTVKHGADASLVFVTRLDNAAPVARATVAIVDREGRNVWQGLTDDDGVAGAPRMPRSGLEPAFIVTAEKDGDLAFAASNWQRRSPAPSYDGADEPVPVVGSVFTDRGVYRQSEQVHVKALLRSQGSGGLELLPEGTPVIVRIEDEAGDEVHSQSVHVNSWSSIEFTWGAGEAKLGRYTAAISRAKDGPTIASTEFRVAAFRRPDFRVDVGLSVAEPVAGARLRGVVAANYLSGPALAGRPVHWRQRSDETVEPPSVIRDRYPDDRYAISYIRSADDYAADNGQQGSGVLDQAGSVSIEVQTSATDRARKYELEAIVDSAAGQQIANRASVVVHPASLYIAMSRPPMFVRPPGLEVGLAAVGLNGTPAAGTQIEVSLIRESWTQQAGSGRSWRRQETRAGGWTVQFMGGDDARLTVPVKDSGGYILRAIATDAAGRRTRTEVWFYVIGAGSASWRNTDHEITLVPERPTWRPGESARLLIESPWPASTALLTVEREGVRRHRVFTMSSQQDTVDVPVTAADIPNIYVSVVLLKGRSGADDRELENAPSYRVGWAELKVEDTTKRLDVIVSADRSEYRPGQSIDVSVQVKDAEHQPARSEVTLWAVDYGVLSLTGYEPPDVVGDVYRPKGLSVMTLNNHARLMRRAAIDSPAPGTGLMAFEGLSTSMASEAVMVSAEGIDGGVIQQEEAARSDFRPVAFWIGSLTTDVNGNAHATARLPDSLTTYRIVAVAGDAQSRFGSGVHNVKVTKLLSLFPAFPRFLLKGDRATFGATVSNTGLQSGEAIVTVESLAPGGIRFLTSRRSIRLAPGVSELVTFDAEAIGASEGAVRIRASLGDDTDGFEWPLRVITPLVRRTSASFGTTTAAANERIAVPSDALRNAGGLTVDLASTVMVGLSESARYLQDYPYECGEQRASRALALILAADLGGAFRLSSLEPAAYRAAAGKALSALRDHQCPRGEFSLWPGQCGSDSEYLTAYVLHVMKRARDTGLPIESADIDEALRYLEGAQSEKPRPREWWPVWLVSRAFVVKVLAEFGRRPVKPIAELAKVADGMPVAALSYLADAMFISGVKGPQYDDIERRIANAIRVESDRAHVEEDAEDVLTWIWNSNVTATATILDGLLLRQASSPLVPMMARWLIEVRTNSRWNSTHENALALEALVDYYRTLEAEVPSMSVGVSVGQKNVGAASFRGRSTEAQRVHLPMSELLSATAAPPASGGAIPLAVSMTGTGRAYYTARLDSVAVDSGVAIDRGFHVERRYERRGAKGEGPRIDFDKGDTIRVTVVVTLRNEGRYILLTDSLPAGVEAIDADLSTSAQLDYEELFESGVDSVAWWYRGTFDYVEKHDDRVVAAATRLAPGRHAFSYLVRATTAGTFTASGARLEAMYAPDVMGRSASVTVTVK